MIIRYDSLILLSTLTLVALSQTRSWREAEQTGADVPPSTPLHSPASSLFIVVASPKPAQLISKRMRPDFNLIFANNMNFPLLTTLLLLPNLSAAIRCYYCTTHDIQTCERMATIVTCPVGFNRCYYSYSMWKPMPTTTSTSTTTTTTTTTTTLGEIDGNFSEIDPPASILAEERRHEALIMQAAIAEERPPEIIDRPNGEDWEKIAQGCARAGVFPCSGSEGRGTRPDQDYCFGDLSYGNCIGMQCNNPGVTPLIFGNSADFQAKCSFLSIFTVTVITFLL